MQAIRERVKQTPWGLKLTRFAGNFYYDPDRTWIPSNFEGSYLVVDGLKYYVNSQVNSVMALENNPWHWFDNLRPTDVALDLGASIGGVTMPMSTLVKHVYAVEPLWCPELEQNLALNNTPNVTLIKKGIGKEWQTTITFGEKSRLCELVRLDALLRSLPKIDVIKIDIEGYEWSFPVEVLKGIREVRVEFHIRKWSRDWQRYRYWMRWMKDEGYHTELVADNRNLSIWVPFKANLAVTASRRDL